MTGFETQLTDILLNVLSVVVTALVAYGIKFIKEHTGVKESTKLNNSIDGLGKIVEAVVADFNQRMVTASKTSNKWDAQYAQMIKRDAMAAVKSQGTPFIGLIEKSLGDVEPLLSTLIEQAVSKAKQK